MIDDEPRPVWMSPLVTHGSDKIIALNSKSV